MFNIFLISNQKSHFLANFQLLHFYSWWFFWIVNIYCLVVLFKDLLDLTDISMIKANELSIYSTSSWISFWVSLMVYNELFTYLFGHVWDRWWTIPGSGCLLTVHWYCLSKVLMVVHFIFIFIVVLLLRRTYIKCISSSFKVSAASKVYFVWSSV